MAILLQRGSLGTYLRTISDVATATAQQLELAHASVADKDRQTQMGASVITGLDYWTGLLDWTTGLDYWTRISMH